MDEVVVKNRYKLRQEKAVQLAAERAKRSPEQQLAKLDTLLGAGIGAVKERARLKAQIEKRKEQAKQEKKKEKKLA
jgi:hypothetical protein